MRLALALLFVPSVAAAQGAPASEPAAAPEPAPAPPPAGDPGPDPAASGDPEAAAEPEPAPAPAPAPEPAAEPKPEEPKPEEPRRDWTLELGGRIFVRDTFTRVDLGSDSTWRHDRELDQVRLQATYDRKRLRIAFELDFAGDDAEVKDTYIRLTPIDALRIEAGRFKVPMSFIGLESKWSLPATERGILSEIEQDDRDLPFAGGRGDGISLELRPEVKLEPRFTLAIFQNPLASGLTPIDPTDEFTQDVYARFETEPVKDLHLAASGALIGFNDQAAAIDTYGHKAMGGLELHVETHYLRAWAEGFAGQSFLYQADGGTSGTFLAARALVAGRLRRPVAPIWRLEPFVGGSVLEPTGDVDGDRVTELNGGVNIAFTKLWRLQIEGAQRFAEGINSIVADSTVIRIQLGARVEEIIE